MALVGSLARLRGFGPGKLRVDILWNLGSLAVYGASGVLLNVLIGACYDAATLGVFNQVLAAYLFASQFAAGGIHYSVLKHVAQHAQDARTCARVIRSALVATALLSVPAAVGFWLVSGPVGALLASPGVAEGMRWATLGLACYALQKVLLGALNGLRRMRIYAVLLAVRPVLLIAALWVAAAHQTPGPQLLIALSLAELGTTALALLIVAPHLRGAGTGDGRWLRVHLHFGARSFLSGALLELNTRVDVLMLGLLATDTVVGVYSFAAIWAEGVAQLLFVLRNNLNPVLVQLLARRDLAALEQLVRRGKRATTLLLAGVGLVGVVAFPLLVVPAAGNLEFEASTTIFAILIGGVVLGAGYFPFGTILMQGGRPGLHSVLMLVCVGVNVAANAALIPLWGAVGAALATAVSCGLSVVLLVVLTRRALGVRL